MRRSMHLLCAAAVGLAACGSDDIKNIANEAGDVANDAKAAGANAGEAVGNAANTASETVTNAAGEAGETVTNAADEAGTTVTNAAPVAGTGGKGSSPRIKLNLKKVGFVGCSRRFMESKMAPKPGVCVIVRSERVTYDTYEISSAKPLPNLARAIAGTGFELPNQHGICMAGPKVLSGVKWHYIKGHCVKGRLKS